MSLAIVTHIVVAIAAALATWTYQGARMDAAVAEVRLEQSNQRLGAVSKARADERAVNKTYLEALNAAQKQARALRRDRELAQSESDGLRGQLSDAARRLADAPPATLREYAATTGELLAQCSGSYQELAGKADGHAADAATCRAAWPVIPSQQAAGTK